MKPAIEAIFFDIGGTLRRSTRRDAAEQRAVLSQMVPLVGGGVTADDLAERLTERAAAYKQWADDTLIELGEVELWTRWMLPDWPAERVAPLAVQLNQLWREATAARDVFPETRAVLVELFRRGYRLGLISNTTSSVEAPLLSKELEIAGMFEVVMLSCEFGRRKPDPEIVSEAARRMGVDPERCAYIGDNPRRDVVSSRRAGFARSVIVGPAGMDIPAEPDAAPHERVESLAGLLDLFPPRASRPAQAVQPAPGGQTWQAAASTMWAQRNFPGLPDFFAAARRLGYASIELNHRITSQMMAGIDWRTVRVTSIHEPCPADVSTDQLKERDWLISAVDEENRRQGVAAIRRSIDLARELGAGAVVVHCGIVTADLHLEKKMRALINAGQADSPDLQALKEEMVAQRALQAGRRFASVRKSVAELVAYASRFGIRLGLENRYHYTDIPVPDELEQLLALGDASQLGFLYDVGHAHTLDRLGFFPHREWLDRFGARIIGTHLHDVIGVEDHWAPGLGEIDFQMVAAALPAGAFRTCEIHPRNSYEQVRAGLKVLADSGCIFPAE